MKTENAIEFLELIKGHTVYLVEIINGIVDARVYQPITLDNEYIKQITDELLEGIVELKTWHHRRVRDFEHYVLYFKVNY